MKIIRFVCFVPLILILTILWLVPESHAQLNTGDILVVDFSAGTGGQGALFRVDPTTGARTLLSDFGVGANQGVDPLGVAVYRRATPIPTMNEWGMIIFMILAGIGSIYYLRRYKRV